MVGVALCKVAITLHTPVTLPTLITTEFVPAPVTCPTPPVSFKASLLPSGNATW